MRAAKKVWIGVALICGLIAVTLRFADYNRTLICVRVGVVDDESGDPIDPVAVYAQYPAIMTLAPSRSERQEVGVWNVYVSGRYGEATIVAEAIAQDDTRVFGSVELEFKNWLKNEEITNVTVRVDTIPPYE